MNSKFHDIETRFDKKVIALDGATFHLQGTHNLNRNQYSLALTDYCVAADKYLRGDDHLNFNIVMRLVYESCIPKMKYSQIKKLIDSREINIDTLISLIQTRNQNGVFTSHITELRRAIEVSKSNNTG